MAESKGAEIARAYVLVVPSLEGSQKRLTEELVPAAETAGKEAGEKGGSHLKDGIAKAAKLAAAAFTAAMAGATALIKQSIDAYAETEQLAGGIQKLFGDEAAVKVMTNAAEAYKTAGVSANDYMQAVTGISAALLKSGISAEEAADLADVAMRSMADNANTFGTKTAEELSLVYQALARGNYTLLDNLSLGYSGSKQGMTELIKDANAFAKATGRAADLSIDNFADIVTAIELIQEKTGIAGTTVKEAEGTISGSLSMLKASWTNLVAGFGDPGADIDALVDNVIRSLGSVASNVTPTVKRIVDGLTKALPDIVKQVASMASELLPSVLEAVVMLATSLAHELPSILETVTSVIVDNAELFIQAAIDVALALVQAVPRILNVLLPKLPDLIQSITSELTKPENLELFIQAATDTVSAIVLALPDIIVGLLDAFPGMIDDLLNPKTGLLSQENIQKMIEAGGKLGSALVQGIITAVGRSKSAIGATLGFDSSVMAGALGVDPSLMAGAVTNSTTIGTVNVNSNSNNLSGLLSDIRRAAAES